MVKDAGHDATERILRRTEREVAKIYHQAEKEAQEKLEKFWRGFEKRDAAKRALMDAGKLSAEEYVKWRKGQMLTGKRWQDLVDTLAKDCVNADKIAVSIINGHLPEVYALNINYGTYQIEHGLGINTSWTLYDRQTVERLIRQKPRLLPKPRVDIPKDLRWNRQHLVREITQGILQGESISEIATRLQKVFGMDRDAAMRNARTAVTGAQNAGRVDSYKRAEAMGIKLKQEWLASHDGMTRESHAEIDGEQVEVGGVFSNGCEYPGDPGGPPEEVYNCRCTLVAALDDAEKSQYRKEWDEYRDDGARHMSFGDWMEARA